MSKNSGRREQKRKNQSSVFKPVPPEESVKNDSNTKTFKVQLKNHWWVILIIAFLSIGALAGGLKYLEEEAKREIAANKDKPLNKQERGFLSSINPFLPMPTPTPTPQLSKEYIYAGSR